MLYIVPPDANKFWNVTVGDCLPDAPESIQKLKLPFGYYAIDHGILLYKTGADGRVLRITNGPAFIAGEIETDRGIMTRLVWKYRGKWTELEVSRYPLSSSHSMARHPELGLLRVKGYVKEVVHFFYEFRLINEQNIPYILEGDD